MPAEPPLRTAPHVVREPDRGDRADRSAAEATTQPTTGRRRPRSSTACGRMRGARPGAGGCDAEPPRSRPVARCLSEARPRHREARARRVDRHPVSQLNPAASGKHAYRAAGERKRCPESGSSASNPLRRRISARAAAFATPKPPPSRCSNRATARSAPVLDERPEVPLEIRVAEEQRPRVELALGERQRLALATPRQTDDARPRLLGHVRRAVPRAVVGDHDLRARKRARQRPHRLADPLLLVARGDEDGELSHRWSSSAPERAGARRRSRSARRRSSPSAHRRGGARARAAPVCSRSSRRSRATSARTPDRRVDRARDLDADRRIPAPERPE